MSPKDHTPCELLTWARFHSLCRRLAERIDAGGFRPDTIVAVARGGYAPGRVLADYLRVMWLSSVRVEHYHGMTASATGARVVDPLAIDLSGRRVLVIDDISDTGDTFDAVLAHLPSRGEPEAVRTAVLLHKRSSRIVPDFHGATIRRWRWVIFPWARIEDLAHLIDDLPDVGTDARAIRRALLERHGLDVNATTIDDALRFGRRWRRAGA